MLSKFPLSPPVALLIREASPRRLLWGRARFRSGLGSCAVRRPGFRRHGPMQSDPPIRKTRLRRGAFSGRLGRSVRTEYAIAAAAPEAPPPAPYPVQRVLTAPMTGAGRERNDLARMQAWTGQSGRLARSLPASELTNALWSETCEMLFDGIESSQQ